MKKKTDGFTLIELLVVMAIIAILAAILVPLAPKLIGTAKRNKAKGEVNTLSMAVKSFYSDYGRMPPAPASGNSAPTIKALIANDPAANPRETVYLELETSNIQGEFLDPWGRQYELFLDSDYDNKVTFDGGTYRTSCIAVSRGPNGAPAAGTATTDSDDITTAK